MPFISLRSEPPTVVFSGDHTIEDEFLHGFLKAQGQAGYEEGFQRALRIGARALLDGRIGVTLNRVEEELDSELVRLRDMLRIAELKERAVKGYAAELSTTSVLGALIERNGWSDAVRDTGSSYGAAGSKVGDVVARIDDRVNVVLEVKMEGRYPLGSPADTDVRDLKKGAKETVYGQLLHALENRDATFGIFVIDAANTAAEVRALGPIHLLPDAPGLLVKVDQAEGRWDNLEVAYQIARQLALVPRWEERLPAVQFVLGRITRDLDHLEQMRADLAKVRASAESILSAAGSAEQRMERTRESLAGIEGVVAQLVAGEGPSGTELAALLEA